MDCVFVNTTVHFVNILVYMMIQYGLDNLHGIK
uniref:Uncharacterized protein n=1 Tax=Ackermannviridae sp. ctUml7 TaxID=2825753 RepID=A0A8S5V9S4_9CAUD|nr:MAG TPA: hypothetical protein [Ackermannviridae sp. ctUml7]